jgi:chromosome segregation ATPase
LRDELAAKSAELEQKAADAAEAMARTEALESRLAELEAGGGGASEANAEAQRLAQERDGLASQIAERDERIARLQREVTDKTDRLGRLAQEIGEAKSKGTFSSK